MTALIVIGSILALLLLLLLAPASVEVRYSGGEAAVKARYLFLRYDLLKKRPKKEKENAPPEKEPEPGPEGGQKKQNRLKTAWDLMKASHRGLSILRRHLVFSRVRVHLRVGGEDAHQAAVSCGKISAALLAALDVIGLLFVLRTPETAVTPDFLSPGVEADLRLRVGIRPLFALMAGASVFCRYVKRPGRSKRYRQKRSAKVVTE